jgi:MFS family permease
LPDGCSEGSLDGGIDGSNVGSMLGLFVGSADGALEGLPLGRILGFLEGSPDGDLDGVRLGTSVGCRLGLRDGLILGVLVGRTEGERLLVGAGVPSVGAFVGVAVGAAVGAAVGSDATFSWHILHAFGHAFLILILFAASYTPHHFFRFCHLPAIQPQLFPSGPELGVMNLKNVSFSQQSPQDWGQAARTAASVLHQNCLRVSSFRTQEHFLPLDGITKSLSLLHT